MGKWNPSKVGWDQSGLGRKANIFSRIFISLYGPKAQELFPKEATTGHGQHPVSGSLPEKAPLRFWISICFCFLETFIKMQMFSGKNDQFPSTTSLCRNLGRKYDFLQEQDTCVHIHVCVCACVYPCPCLCAYLCACVHVGVCSCVSV